MEDKDMGEKQALWCAESCNKYLDAVKKQEKQEKDMMKREEYRFWVVYLVGIIEGMLSMMVVFLTSS